MVSGVVVLPLFHCTTDVLMKPVPVMLSVMLDEPTVAVEGVSPPVVRIVGAPGGATLNGTEFDTLPVPFDTLTNAVSAVVRSVEGTTAVICVALT